MRYEASVGAAFQHAASSGPLAVALAACVLAGLVSFASPCVVPLVPGYLSYLAGLVGSQAPPVTVTEARVGTWQRWRVVGAAALFVVGFTAVFALASVTVFGLIGTLALDRALLQRMGGAVTMGMGLVFVGLVPALQRERRVRPRQWTGLLGAPLLGAVFALGWTPCLGPTLSGVMAAAVGTTGATAARGTALVIAYCLGLGVPFLVLAFGSATALRGVGWLRRHARTVQLCGGVLLVAVGAALLAGVWDLFVGWVRDAFVSQVSVPI